MIGNGGRQVFHNYSGSSRWTRGGGCKDPSGNDLQ